MKIWMRQLARGSWEPAVGLGGAHRHAKMAMPGETEQQRKLRMCTLPRHEPRTGQKPARQPPSNASFVRLRLRD